MPLVYPLERRSPHAPRRRPARPIDPQEGTPAAAICNNRLCRRSPTAIPAANYVQQICNFLASRLKCRSASGGRRRPAALLERPHPTLGPVNPISHPYLLNPPAVLSCRKGRHPRGNHVPFSAHLSAAHFNSNICLTPLGILVSLAGNTSGLVRTGADDRFTRPAVALACSARDPISLHRSRAAWRCDAIEAEPQHSRVAVAGECHGPSGWCLGVSRVALTMTWPYCAKSPSLHHVLILY
jgi:hypothetical protein